MKKSAVQFKSSHLAVHGGLLTLHQQLHLDSNLTSVLYKLFTYLLKQYSKTQPEVIPKFSCDVSLANGELRQACGHVMLSS